MLYDKNYSINELDEKITVIVRRTFLSALVMVVDFLIVFWPPVKHGFGDGAYLNDNGVTTLIGGLIILS